MVRGEEMARIGIRQATKQGWIEITIPGCADLSYPKSELRRGRVQGGGWNKPYYNNNEWYMQNHKMAKKIICLGFYDSGTGKHQSNTVYAKSGKIPAITTITGGVLNRLRF